MASVEWPNLHGGGGRPRGFVGHPAQGQGVGCNTLMHTTHTANNTPTKHGLNTRVQQALSRTTVCTLSLAKAVALGATEGQLAART